MSSLSRHWSVYGKASAILVVAASVWLAWYCGAVAATKPVAAAGFGGAITAARAEGAGVLEDPLRARLEQLSEQEMKAFYTRCSQAGIERHLDGGEAMACSVGYDVLLNKHFDGDFERLLTWSRSRRAGDVR